MQILTPTRPVSLPTTLGTLLVALAVFGWGLQYKLSLYQRADGASRFTLHAKLLSQKERLVANAADEAVRLAMPRPQSSIEYPAPLLCIIALSLLLVSFLRTQSTAVDGHVQHYDLAASSFFSFRPPPVVA